MWCHIHDLLFKTSVSLFTSYASMIETPKLDLRAGKFLNIRCYFTNQANRWILYLVISQGVLLYIMLFHLLPLLLLSHWYIHVLQNITVNSTLFFITIYIRVRIINLQFADRKSKVKFREPLLTRFLFLREL